MDGRNTGENSGMKNANQNKAMAYTHENGNRKTERNSIGAKNKLASTRNGDEQIKDEIKRALALSHSHTHIHGFGLICNCCGTTRHGIHFTDPHLDS